MVGIPATSVTLPQNVNESRMCSGAALNCLHGCLLDLFFPSHIEEGALRRGRRDRGRSISGSRRTPTADGGSDCDGQTSGAKNCRELVRAIGFHGLPSKGFPSFQSLALQCDQHQWHRRNFRGISVRTGNAPRLARSSWPWTPTTRSPSSTTSGLEGPDGPWSRWLRLTRSLAVPQQQASQCRLTSAGKSISSRRV